MSDQIESTADPSTAEGSGASRSLNSEAGLDRHGWNAGTLRSRMEEEDRDCGIGSGSLYRRPPRNDPNGPAND